MNWLYKLSPKIQWQWISSNKTAKFIPFPQNQDLKNFWIYVFKFPSEPLSIFSILTYLCSLKTLQISFFTKSLYFHLAMASPAKVWPVNLPWLVELVNASAQCLISMLEATDKLPLNAPPPFKSICEKDNHHYLKLFDDRPKRDGIMISPRSILRMRVEKAELACQIWVLSQRPSPTSCLTLGVWRSSVSWELLKSCNRLDCGRMWLARGYCTWQGTTRIWKTWCSDGAYRVIPSWLLRGNHSYFVKPNEADDVVIV